MWFFFWRMELIIVNECFDNFVSHTKRNGYPALDSFWYAGDKMSADYLALFSSINPYPSCLYSAFWSALRVMKTWCDQEVSINRKQRSETKSEQQISCFAEFCILSSLQCSISFKILAKTILLNENINNQSLPNINNIFTFHNHSKNIYFKWNTLLTVKCFVLVFLGNFFFIFVFFFYFY